MSESKASISKIMPISNDFISLIVQATQKLLTDGYYEYCCIMAQTELDEDVSLINNKISNELPSTCDVKSSLFLDPNYNLSFPALLNHFDLNLVQLGPDKFKVEYIGANDRQMMLARPKIDGQIVRNSQTMLLTKVNQCMGYLDTLFEVNVKEAEAFNQFYRAMHDLRINAGSGLPGLYDRIGQNFHSSDNDLYISIPNNDTVYAIQLMSIWSLFWSNYDRLEQYQNETQTMIDDGWSMKRLIYQPRLLDFQPDEKLVAFRKGIQTMPEMLKCLQQDGFTVHPDLANIKGCGNDIRDYQESIYMFNGNNRQWIYENEDDFLNNLEFESDDHAGDLVNVDPERITKKSLLQQHDYDEYCVDDAYDNLCDAMYMIEHEVKSFFDKQHAVHWNELVSIMQQYDLKSWLALADKAWFKRSDEYHQFIDALSYSYQNKNVKRFISQKGYITPMGKTLLLVLIMDQFDTAMNHDLDKLGFDDHHLSNLELFNELDDDDLDKRLRIMGLMIHEE